MVLPYITLTSGTWEFFIVRTQYAMICWLFQGTGPTVARAMVVNAAQLATYSQAKQILLSTGK